MTYPVAMRGINEASGEYLGPSRKQNRREALEVLSLADDLAALSENQLGKLPIPEGLLTHIADARRITSHIARKRQLAFLAKQMRRESDETLEAIRDAMDAGGTAARADYFAHRYHQPSDAFDDSWDMAGPTADTRTVYRLAEALANGESWPAWDADSEFSARRVTSDSARATPAR